MYERIKCFKRSQILSCEHKMININLSMFYLPRPFTDIDIYENSITHFINLVISDRKETLQTTGSNLLDL